MGLDPRTSWEVAGGYNPWTFGDNRKLKFWTAQTEFRYWLRRRFAGHFFGLHVLYADYNAGGVKLFGMGDRRYEGFLYGAGLSYGYQWVVGRRWNSEAMRGVGYILSLIHISSAAWSRRRLRGVPPFGRKHGRPPGRRASGRRRGG